MQDAGRLQQNPSSLLGWHTLCHFYQGLCIPLQPHSRGSPPQVLSKGKTVLLVVGDHQASLERGSGVQ